MNMKKWLLSLAGILLISMVSAQDTITVQTLTFDSITTRRGTWQFPEGESFRKILMYHTLKCDVLTTHDQYPCGEWDYLTYNIIYRHTGLYDSTLYYHPNFTLIEGSSPDSVLLSSAPTYYYLNNRHFTVTYPDTLVYEQAEIGSDVEIGFDAIRTDHRAGRSQFLWKAEELADQNFTAGPITGLKLNVPGPGAATKHFMIRMKNVELEALTPDTLIADLDTVFCNSVEFVAGWLDLNFFKPFEWDGQSDIVVDFSFTNPTGLTETGLLVEDPGFNCGITAGSDGFALDLDGVSDFLQIPESNYFVGDFTFEVWFLKRSNNNWSRIFDFGNGPDKQNVIVVLSKETSGKLSFHVHKDGQNRSFELNDPTPLNEWTHLTLRLTTNIGWVYLNGNLLKLGQLQRPPNISRQVNYIGRSNWSGDKAADVLIDEFRLYKTPLDPAVIKSHYRQELVDPVSDTNLVLYFKFDEWTGTVVSDSSQGAHHATGFGLPNWYPVRGPEIFLGYAQCNLRPDIIFERLESSGVQLFEEQVRDSVMNTQTQMILFENPGDPTIPTDTITSYRAGYQYVYENWKVVDSVWFEPDQVMRKEQIPYYGEPFEVLEQFEIGRYITPYGINLSLGPGFTWIYDVTDYAPLLQGMVDLSAGNQQELIDLKFVFIKGTPPRDVKKIDRLWGGLRSYYYKDLDDDIVLNALTMPLLPDASQFRVKTRFTGHGHNSNTGEYPHCCEWKDNEHYLFVNGEQAAAWHIFQYHDCALNPVYPQGGTWPGAREGWCPGDLVKEHDYEITEFITGNEVTLDYDITPVPQDNLGMGWGNYVVNMDLIHYGPNHFDTDAEIYGIISPNNYQYYSRINPICYGPSIILRNNGSSALQTVTVNYGVSGGSAETYVWNGSILPHCLDTINLPVPGDIFWIGDEDHIFTATIRDPNGITDQYPDNDSFSASFIMPDLIDIPVVMLMRTNNQSYRYSLEVRDIGGNILFRRDTFDNNTIYQDTLDLPFGCYTIELTDIEDMGLSYWAYPEQGSGYFRLLDLDGNILKKFNSEFGRTIYYTFHVGEGFYIREPGYDELISIYPNPTSGVVNIDIRALQGNVSVKICNMQGSIVKQTEENVLNSRTMVFDLSDCADGFYLIEVNHPGLIVRKKVIKL
jgi:hypothetical protein